MKLPITLKALQGPRRAGFTMIELLVVISVIGVLAVAVLASINPIEQVNKGRDTRTRSDAAQLLNAIDRYYAIQEVYPWNDVSGTSVPTPELEFDCPDGQMTQCIGNNLSWVGRLATTAEIKDAFQVRAETAGGNIYFYKDVGIATGDTETTYACFIPRSRQFALEARKKCVDNLTPDVDGTTQDVFCANNRTDLADPIAGTYICLP